MLDFSCSQMKTMKVNWLLKHSNLLLVNSRTSENNNFYIYRIKFSFSKPDDGFGLFARLAEYVGANQEDLPNLMLIDPS